MPKCVECLYHLSLTLHASCLVVAPDIRWDADIKVPCEKPTEEDRNAAMAAASRAVARLERHTGDRLLLFVLLYIDMLQRTVVDPPLGVYFLEQCLPQTPNKS